MTENASVLKAVVHFVKLLSLFSGACKGNISEWLQIVFAVTIRAINYNNRNEDALQRRSTSVTGPSVAIERPSTSVSGLSYLSLKT